MIRASEARSMAKTHMDGIYKKIRNAAKEGESGIWLSGLTLGQLRNLRELGYECTSETENYSGDGIDRRGQTWVWWGN